MSRAKVPTRLVLVVVACVVVGVIGFQAVAERTRVNRRLQAKDELQERLRVRLTAVVERHTRLQAENVKLSSEKDELQKHLIELTNSRQDEKDQVEKNIKDLGRRLHDKELEVQKLEDKVRDLEQVKSRAARKREQKEKAFVSLQDKNSALSKEIADLQAEIKGLKEGGVKDVSEANIKSVLEGTHRLVTGNEENGSELDDGTARTARMLVTDKHKDPTNEQHHVSQSINVVVDDSKGTDKEDDEETEEDKSDVVDTDEEAEKEDLQIETNNDNDEDSENNDFKDEEEVKTVDDKEAAEDDTDEKDEDLKTVENRIFQKGNDEEDTAELDDQEETLDNTE